MMGHNHAAAGLTVGVLTAPWFGITGPAAVAAWVVAVGGFTLLSDVDTLHSSAARMWGPLSQLMWRPVALMAGGHRWGTHDAVLAPVCFAAAAWIAGRHEWTSAALLAVAIGLALRGLSLCGMGRVGAPLNLALSASGSWWLTQHGHGMTGAMLPATVALGVITHIAGDALTTCGVPVPIVWIRTRARVGIPLFTTGGVVEALVVSPLLALAFVWLSWKSEVGHHLSTYGVDLLRQLRELAAAIPA